MPRPVLGELVAQRQVLVLQREAVRERVAAGADDVARVLAGVHRYGVVVGVVASAAGDEDVCRAVVLCVERDLGECGSRGHLRLPSVVTDWVTAGVVCLPAAAVKPDRLEAPRKLRRESSRRNKRAPGRVCPGARASRSFRGGASDQGVTSASCGGRLSDAAAGAAGVGPVIAGRVIRCGSASSPMVASPRLSRLTIASRVGSASAPNVVASTRYVTEW